MDSVQQGCIYARHLKNVCTVIEETAVGALEDSSNVDGVVSDLLMIQLESAQMLVLALTDKLTEVLHASRDTSANADGEGSVFGSGELDHKSSVTVENPVTAGRKAD